MSAWVERKMFTKQTRSERYSVLGVSILAALAVLAWLWIKEGN